MTYTSLAPTPLLGSELISKWAENEPSIVELMEEESKFIYKHENLPIRLFFPKHTLGDIAGEEWLIFYYNILTPKF